MKYISMDDIVDICQCNITPLKAYKQGVAVSALRRVIEAAKEYAVEAEQKIHAHWEINPDGYYPYCSNCKNEPKGREMTDYCPNCGAIMDGGAD
jgi:Zn finger protein HypA/HybF involved in hydrogenase expression